MRAKITTFLILFTLSATAFPVIEQAIAQETPRRLRAAFTGDKKCLDIINDGENNKLTMADCGNFSGQMWYRKPTNQRGFYKILNQFSGDKKCLDVINDGENNKLIMADCDNYSGQMWTMRNISTSSSRRFRLTNQFTGDKKCLDIINDGKNNQLTMADCGNYSGQMWVDTK